MLDQLREALASLLERRSTAVEALETITRTAEEREDRQLTAEEDTDFVARMGEVTEIDDEIAETEERISGLEAIEARSAKINEQVPFNVNRGRDPLDNADINSRERVSRGEVHARVRSFLQNDDERTMPLSEEQRGSVQRLLGSDSNDAVIGRHILAHGSEAYRNAWPKVLFGQSHLLTDAERAAVSVARAASLTDADGGFAVPTTLDPTIIDTGTGSVNPMRQIATTKTITNDVWAGLSSAGITAGFAAEASEVGDDAPTLAHPTITPARADAFVPGSFEIFADWPNMQRDIGAMFATAKDDVEATAHFTGSGSDAPVGIVTALTGGASVVASATADTFAVADLYAVEEALPARHRARASWTGNKPIYNDVRQFDTAGGANLWVRLGAGQPGELIGYNAYESSAMDGTITAAADNYVLIIGDFANYYIVDRVGMAIEFVPHLFATANNRPSGERGLLAWWRTGGDSVNDDAFRMLNVT